jgi:hypothetical protein
MPAHSATSPLARKGAGPDAPEVRLTEEQIADRYPLDYRKLVTSLKGRLPELKINAAFHKEIKALKGNTRFVFRRHIDPGDPKSQYREFYSHAALDVLAQKLKVTPTAAVQPEVTLIASSSRVPDEEK